MRARERRTGEGAATRVSMTSSKLIEDTSTSPTIRSASPGCSLPLFSAVLPSTVEPISTPEPPPASLSSSTKPSGFVSSTSRVATPLAAFLAEAHMLMPAAPDRLDGGGGGGASAGIGGAASGAAGGGARATLREVSPMRAASMLAISSSSSSAVLSP